MLGRLNRWKPIIDNLIILPHQDGIHIIDIIQDSPLKLYITSEGIEEKPEIKSDFYKNIKGNLQSYGQTHDNLQAQLLIKLSIKYLFGELDFSKTFKRH